MFAEMLAMIGTAGVVASLVFVALQTRELSRQTRANNRIAVTTGMYNALERSHQLDFFLAEQPQLRAYLYEGLPCVESDANFPVVATLAEVLADVIDYGLMVAELLPGTEQYIGWGLYATHAVDNSPHLRQHLAERPEWYPQLSRHVDSSIRSCNTMPATQTRTTIVNREGQDNRHHRVTRDSGPLEPKP